MEDINKKYLELNCNNEIFEEVAKTHNVEVNKVKTVHKFIGNFIKNFIEESKDVEITLPYFLTIKKSPRKKARKILNNNLESNV